ncbi:unnamed protein product [Scytosiphon promiscuus]
MLGMETHGLALVLAVIVTLIVACAWYFAKCERSLENPISESFKWPSSSRFLKSVDPAHPPGLVVEKYQDPIREDSIPLDCETKWTVVYQPKDGLQEVKQHMYLRFREGAVFGVGYEHARKLCKIVGKYRLNRKANQIVLVMTCKFWDERDTVMFHGWGNGTGLVGNCYIRELDPFSALGSIPGLRQHGACTKYTASFLMLKMPGMGTPDLRALLHTRRVHKWAGNLYPDDSRPLPLSPMRSPRRAARATAESADIERSFAPPPQLQRKRSSLLSNDGSRGGDGGGGSTTSSSSSRKAKILGLFPSFTKQRSSRTLQPESIQDPTQSSSANELPPWVRQGGRPESPVREGEDGRNGYPYPSAMASQASGRRARRPSSPPIDTLDYLQLKGVPGRSGPMV